jgi:AraC-like DNA-binding protein
MFNINEKIFNLSAGNILFIPAEQKYTRYPINNTDCKMVYLYFKTTSPIEALEHAQISDLLRRFDEEVADNILTPSDDFQELEKDIFISDHLDTAFQEKVIYDICKAIEAKLIVPKRYNRLYNSARMLELLSILGQISISDYRCNTLSTSVVYPLPLEKAIVYITKNYHKKINMGELSKYCNVSPQHLIRLFHTHMNSTPMQYINQNKISHAVEMLMTTDLSISEISYKLGLSDPGYFSRLFKKIQNRSPNEARSYIQSYDKNQIKNRDVAED